MGSSTNVRRAGKEVNCGCAGAPLLSLFSLLFSLLRHSAPPSRCLPAGFTPPWELCAHPPRSVGKRAGAVFASHTNLRY
jgi:hypothetical protein